MPRFDMTRIEEARFEAGLKRGEYISDRMMAEAVGVNTRIIWAWRNGKIQNPDPGRVITLAKYLGVDPRFFVVDDDVNKKSALRWLEKATTEGLVPASEVLPT